MNKFNLLLNTAAALALVLIACDSDTASNPSMNDDPYELGGTYHDYRSCEDQAGDPIEEPMSGMMMEAMAPDEEMTPEDEGDGNAALISELPTGDGAFLASGAYFLRIDLVELGFVLDLQLEVEGMSTDSDGVLTAMRLRAIKDDAISEPFAEDTNIDVSDAGVFTANFANAALPGDFSPTGSDVLFDLSVIGAVQSETTLCGFVTGQIQTLDLALERSTFSAVPWEMRGDDVPKSCGDDGGNAGCERLTAEQCPDLVAGENTLTSCGLERRVRIRLPSTFDASRRDYKAVVLFHGLTGEQVDDIEEDTALNKLVDPYDFVLLSPYSLRLPIEWDQASPGDNPDVALFDDLLTCAEAKLGADNERLYLAGDSGGGMFSTFLVSQFADRIAAAAINSGGTIFDLPNTSARKVPVIYGWGGTCDQARGQDFSTLGATAIAGLVSNGNFVTACNHDSGHEWKPFFSPWFLEFLFAHRKSDTVSPFAEGLPDTLPDFCEIRSAD
jgi:predicted esterase